MSMLRSPRFLAVALMLSLPLVACGGDAETPTPSTGEVAPESTPEPELQTMAPTAEKVDLEAARTTARMAMFVPAPSEFQAALTASKVDIDITRLLKESPRSLVGKSRSIIALESGVRMSNVLMTAASGDQAMTLVRLRAAHEALGALGVPKDVLTEAETIIGDFEKGSIVAAELVPALDLLNQKLQDDLAASNDTTVATLVQAGGWLQGAHLLSQSLADAGEGGDAAALLHQPSVLAHFKEFLNKTAAGDPAIDAVLAEMTLLEAIASKDELAASDMAGIATHTGNILDKF